MNIGTMGTTEVVQFFLMSFLVLFSILIGEQIRVLVCDIIRNLDIRKPNVKIPQPSTPHPIQRGYVKYRDMVTVTEDGMIRTLTIPEGYMWNGATMPSSTHKLHNTDMKRL